MLIVISFLFLITPILSFPFLIFGALFDKKYRMIYLIELSIVLGFLAFFWVPTSEYDLYRWYVEMNILGKYKISDFLNYMISNGEPLGNLIKYTVSMTNNFGLLQFSIASVGYAIIFYIITGICNKYEVSKLTFLITTLLVTTKLIYINYISGLFFYFSSILFCLSIYLLYFKNKKILSIITMIFSFFIHTSMIYPIIIFVVFKLTKEKNNMSNLILVFIGILLLNTIIPYIIAHFNIPILSELSLMYQGYFIGKSYDNQHAGYVLLVNILNILPILIALIFNNTCHDKSTSFSLLLLFGSVIIYFYASIFIRYLFISLLLFTPCIVNTFKNMKNPKNKVLYFSIIFGVCSISILYQFELLRQINFIQIIYENMFKSIFSILK